MSRVAVQASRPSHNPSFCDLLGSLWLYWSLVSSRSQPKFVIERPSKQNSIANGKLYNRGYSIMMMYTKNRRSNYIQDGTEGGRKWQTFPSLT